MQSTLQEMGQHIMTRLEIARDVIAGDVRYHSVCILKNNKQTYNRENRETEFDLFETLKGEIECRTSRGQAVLLSECWQRFHNLCDDNSVPVPLYFKTRPSLFKTKLLKMLPNVNIIPKQDSDFEDDIIVPSSYSVVDVCDLLTNEGFEDLNLPAYNENEMIHMVHVALYLRSLILNQEENKRAELTEETSYACIPEALHIFMSLMYGGSDILDESLDTDDSPDDSFKKATRLRRSILNISQDIVYGVSKGKTIPPKQYSLGLAVHQISGRKKNLSIYSTLQDKLSHTSNAYKLIQLCVKKFFLKWTR